MINTALGASSPFYLNIHPLVATRLLPPGIIFHLLVTMSTDAGNLGLQTSMEDLGSNPFGYGAGDGVAGSNNSDEPPG